MQHFFRFEVCDLIQKIKSDPFLNKEIKIRDNQEKICFTREMTSRDFSNICLWNAIYSTKFNLVVLEELVFSDLSCFPSGIVFTITVILHDNNTAEIRRSNRKGSEIHELTSSTDVEDILIWLGTPNV